jgi:hypothetical protein
MSEEHDRGCPLCGKPLADARVELSTQATTLRYDHSDGSTPCSIVTGSPRRFSVAGSFSPS